MRVALGLVFIVGALAAWHYWDLAGGVAFLLGLFGIGLIESHEWKR